MFVARIVGGALALLAVPNSTSSDRADLAQASLPQSPAAAVAYYAPDCNARCGWEALPFAH